MANKVLSFLGKLGGFLLDSLKRSTGTDTVFELLGQALELAGGFILGVERENKKTVKEGGQSLEWHEKFKRAVDRLVEHYAAQGKELAIHDAAAIVAQQFVKINQERIAAGKVALASRDNMSSGIYNSYNSSGEITGTITGVELAAIQDSSKVQ